MVERITSPSQNPADYGTLSGLFRLFRIKMQQSMEDMLPAKVIAYDRATNRAQVQPLIAVVTTDNRRINRAVVASVPVLQLGGGGFVVSFPINPGDIGWIKANDRDISLFLQFYNNTAPNTQRTHSFEDAMFIPDTMLNDVTIAEEDADNLVIQNYAGTVKVAWWSTFLKIIAPRVGIGVTPDANAIFHVQSVTKASIPWPRMTTAQRNSIPSPQDGMVVWLTDTHGLSTYNDLTDTWS